MISQRRNKKNWTNRKARGTFGRGALLIIIPHHQTLVTFRTPLLAFIRSSTLMYLKQSWSVFWKHYTTRDQRNSVFAKKRSQSILYRFVHTCLCRLFAFRFGGRSSHAAVDFRLAFLCASYKPAKSEEEKSHLDAPHG